MSAHGGKFWYMWDRLKAVCPWDGARRCLQKHTENADDSYLKHARKTKWLSRSMWIWRKPCPQWLFYDRIMCKKALYLISSAQKLPKGKAYQRISILLRCFRSIVDVSNALIIYLTFIDPFLVRFQLNPDSVWSLSDFSSVQSLSHVLLFAIPWIAACQASLSITNSQTPNSRSSLRLMSIQSVMPSSHLILCRPLLQGKLIYQPTVAAFGKSGYMHLACKTPMNHRSGVPLDFSLFMSCPGQPRLGDRSAAALTARWGEGENEEWIEKRRTSLNTREDSRVSSRSVRSWTMRKHKVGGVKSCSRPRVHQAPGGQGRGVVSLHPAEIIACLFTCCLPSDLDSFLRSESFNKSVMWATEIILCCLVSIPKRSKNKQMKLKKKKTLIFSKDYHVNV